MNLLEVFNTEKEKHPLSSSFIVFHKVIHRKHVQDKILLTGFLKLVDKHDYEQKDRDRLVAWLIIETNN